MSSMLRPVALIGLPPAERAFFATLFRTHDQSAGYGYTIIHDPNIADVLIVNADNDAAVKELSLHKLQASVILVGESRHGTHWPLLRRPLMFADVRALMRRLETKTASAEDAEFGSTIKAGLASRPVTLPDFIRDAAQTTPAPLGMQQSLQLDRPPAPAKAPAKAPPKAAPAQGGTIGVHRSWDGRPLSTVPVNENPARGFAATQVFEHDIPLEPGQPVAQQAFRGHSRYDAAVAATMPPRPAPGYEPGPDTQNALLWREAANTQSASAHKLPPMPYAEMQSIADAPSRPPPPRVSEPSMMSMTSATATDAASVFGHSRAPAMTPSAKESDFGASTTGNRSQLPVFVSPADADILLIDRRRPEHVALALWLRRLGRKTILVQSQNQALQALAQAPFRFVFLDEQSIGHAVFKLIKAVRVLPAMDDGPRPKVVVIANHSGWFTRLRAKLAGCDFWMTMPLRKQTVLAFLNRDAPPSS